MQKLDSSKIHPLDFYYQYLGRHINAPHNCPEVDVPCMYCNRTDVPVYETHSKPSPKRIVAPKCNACYSITRKHLLPVGTRAGLMPTHGAIITEKSVRFFANTPVLTKGNNIIAIDPKGTKISLDGIMTDAALELTDAPALFIRFDADPTLTISSLKMTTDANTVHICGHRDYRSTIFRPAIKKHSEILDGTPVDKLWEASRLENEFKSRTGSPETIRAKLIKLYEKYPNLQNAVSSFPPFNSKKFKMLRNTLRSRES